MVEKVLVQIIQVTVGTTNSGGGGGGGENTRNDGGGGGKGIVLIKYKFLVI